jgi:hypothetical protein
MRQVITGLLVQVEITGYDEAGRVAGRPDKPIQFSTLEADIPADVLEWVRIRVGMKGD